MPLGTRHVEIGILRERDGRFSLRPDGGGEWRLEFGVLDILRGRRLAGRRVRVRGTRDGYDLLAVDEIREIGPDGPAWGVEPSLRALLGRALSLVRSR